MSSQDTNVEKVPEMKFEKKIKLADYEDVTDFKIKNIEQYPNRLICFIKFKVSSLKEKPRSIFGTGCMLDQKYVLTSAHTIYELWKIKNEFGAGYKIDATVKQALHEGKAVNQYRIKQETIIVSKPYRDNKKDNDFAIFQIEPIPGGEFKPEEKFMPVVALKERDAKHIKQISLYGYPFFVNKKNSSEQDLRSSVFMSNAYGAKGPAIGYQPGEISYQLPTDSGVSGGPIMSYNDELKEYIVIGIHRAFTSKLEANSKQENRNFGVTSLQMLQEVNQWGYQLNQKPFIYTKETYFMRNNPKIFKTDIFNLMDRNLDEMDMHVFSGFNFSHIKKLILSGNKIKGIGVKFLLKRQFPNLQSLFLSQNEIQSVQEITDDEWKRIKNVKNLSLSLNYLKSLPINISILGSLQILSLCYNCFETIPEVLSNFSKNQKEQRLTVHLYNNRFKKNDQSRPKIKENLTTNGVDVLLNKHEK